MDLDSDHWRGGERAAVTLVEYGDYACSYSRMAFRAIQRLEQQLGGQLRFVFRHSSQRGKQKRPRSSPYPVSLAGWKPVTWVMAKPKTRSKNSSSGVTRSSPSIERTCISLEYAQSIAKFETRPGRGGWFRSCRQALGRPFFD